jgi:hypothetical protein
MDDQNISPEDALAWRALARALARALRRVATTDHYGLAGEYTSCDLCDGTSTTGTLRHKPKCPLAHPLLTGGK